MYKKKSHSDLSRPADDKELLKIIKGCRKRLRTSQKSLYKKFYAFGMSITFRYTGNKEEAVEVLNDGFMKIYQNIGKFKTKYPFMPWFKKIILNTAINHFKKESRRMEDTYEEFPEKPIQESIISGISYQELIGMVQKLPPAYRTVFNMFVIEGYKHEEIAEELEISVGASKSNLHKAKARLRKILSEYLEQDA